MPVLALETATLVSGVALATESALLAEWKLETAKNPFRAAAAAYRNAAASGAGGKTTVASSGGQSWPWVFYRLRIGLATAKALAYALRFRCWAYRRWKRWLITVPRRGCCFRHFWMRKKAMCTKGVSRIEKGGCGSAAPRVVAFRTALEELVATGEPAMALGEGVAWLRQPEYEAWREALVPTPLSVAMPRAASVAALAWQRLQQGDCDEAMTLEPMYIRRSEAEVLWEKRHGREVDAG